MERKHHGATFRGFCRFDVQMPARRFPPPWSVEELGVVSPHKRGSTYYRCVSGEPSLLYLVSPLLAVVGILGLFSLSWAISTRLLALCWGSGCVYCALVPYAQLLARSGLVLVPCGLCWLFWMCFLIHEKFDGSRICLFRE